MPELSDKIERAHSVTLNFGIDDDGCHDIEYLLDDERQMIVNALRQLEAKLALVK